MTVQDGFVSESQVCLNAFREHWAQAQIDGPMNTIARYDDVAKLLITIGGFLLAVMAQGYSAMLKEPGTRAQMKTKSQVIFYLILLFFATAAGVCLPQPKRLAWNLLTLTSDQNLECLLKKWCKNIENVIRLKRVLLLVAVISFVISFLFMIQLLLSPFS